MIAVGSPDDIDDAEWLVTNGLGGYASGTFAPAGYSDCQAAPIGFAFTFVISAKTRG
ncbi:MAG TPA: hypothetical protein VJ719_10035 [Chthoniobacterales bacterium]|nr:hypothetical protein [Chthoniobacterales bacterium]